MMPNDPMTLSKQLAELAGLSRNSAGLLTTDGCVNVGHLVLINLPTITQALEAQEWRGIESAPEGDSHE